MSKKENIEIRSDEFQEILGDIPSWILRWGITILSIIIIIISIGCSIFKYPDIITSDMQLTGRIPPAKIVAMTNGKLQELYVEDNQFIKTGTCIGVIENPARTNDMLYLKEFLLNIDIDTISEIPNKNLQLGDLQNTYSNFYLTLFEYSEYKRVGYLSEKSYILKKRINQYLIRKSNLLDKKKIIKQKVEISKSKFDRDSLLLSKGILSKEDFENSNNLYLESLLSYENISESLNDVQVQIGQIEESLFDANYTNNDTENSLITKLNSLITELNTGIHEWELKYLLISPIDGKITFTDYWVKNQNIIASKEIFSIIPIDSIKPFGKAYLPINRSGKVHTGQTVNIRFTNFPDNEFGVVKGIVRNISLVPTGDNDNYVIEIEFPNGLITTYNKKLPYNANSHAKADIITEDMSLLERFFLPFKKILSENLEQ